MPQFWLHHTMHCAELSALPCWFCVSKKGGTVDGWCHPQGAVHMVAARLGCKRAPDGQIIDNIPSPGLETAHVLLYVRLLSSRTERVGVVVTFEVLIGLILIGSRSTLSLRKKQKATDNLHR